MLAVCFVPPSSERDVNHWSFVLSHFAPDCVFVMQDSKGLVGAYSWLCDGVDVQTADDLPDLPLVLLAPLEGRYVQGVTSLADFDHPADAVYMLGSDHAHMSGDYLGGREPDHTVYIPTAGGAEMYSHVAAAIALYDRAAKAG